MQWSIWFPQNTGCGKWRQQKTCLLGIGRKWHEYVWSTRFPEHCAELAPPPPHPPAGPDIAPFQRHKDARNRCQISPDDLRVELHQLWEAPLRWVHSPTHLPPLPTRNYSWYSFLSEADSTRGPSAVGRIISMKKSNEIIGNRTRDLPACSAVPQPTAPPR
jgi:hypothetical protein